MTTIEQTSPEKAEWHTRQADDVTAQMGVDPGRGLDPGEAERRLGQYGPNELPKEPLADAFTAVNLRVVIRTNLGRHHLRDRSAVGHRTDKRRLACVRSPVVARHAHVRRGLLPRSRPA